MQGNLKEESIMAAILLSHMESELLCLQIFIVAEPAKQFCSACVAFLAWT